jgi:hypothetical protein
VSDSSIDLEAEDRDRRLGVGRGGDRQAEEQDEEAEDALHG